MPQRTQEQKVRGNSRLPPTAILRPRLRPRPEFRQLEEIRKAFGGIRVARPPTNEALGFNGLSSLVLIQRLKADAHLNKVRLMHFNAGGSAGDYSDYSACSASTD